MTSQIKLEEIISLNSVLSEKFQASLGLIIKSLQKSKFQKTGRALTNFILKSSSLNNSILIGLTGLRSLSN